MYVCVCVWCGVVVVVCLCCSVKRVREGWGGLSAWCLFLNSGLLAWLRACNRRTVHNPKRGDGMTRDGIEMRGCACTMREMSVHACLCFVFGCHLCDDSIPMVQESLFVAALLE